MIGNNEEILDEDMKFYLYGRVRNRFYNDSIEIKNPQVPRQVCLKKSTIPCSNIGVFSRVWIGRGTEMGPFTGTPVADIDVNVHNKHVWEVVDAFNKIIYFIDGGTDERPASWLTCVQCARFDREQNLEVVQIHQHLYYRAIKDIAPEEELLVWYSQSDLFHMFMSQGQSAKDQRARNFDAPILNDKIISFKTSLGNKLRCVVCKREFNSRSNLRSHMRIHTLEKPFSCRYCNRRFSQSSTLRNHIRLHTGEKPYKCFVCKSNYSQLAGLRAHQRSSRHKPTLLNADIKRDITEDNST